MFHFEKSMSEKKYYTMYVDNNSRGSADAPDEYYYDDLFDLSTPEELPFTFKLDNNIFHDLIGTNLDKILFSLRAKNLFDQHKMNAPVYDQLEANVQSENGKVNFKYYLLMFR